MNWLAALFAWTVLRQRALARRPAELLALLATGLASAQIGHSLWVLLREGSRY